jgi:hypothetical protein
MRQRVLTEMEGWHEALTDKRTVLALLRDWLIIVVLTIWTMAALRFFGSPEEALLFTAGVGLGALLLNLRFRG